MTVLIKDLRLLRRDWRGIRDRYVAANKACDGEADEELQGLAQDVIELCLARAELDLGQAEARQLLLPVLVWISQHDSAKSALALPLRVLKTHEDFQFPGLASLVQDMAPDQRQETAVPLVTIDIPLAQKWLVTGQGDDDYLGGVQERAALTSLWLGMRSSIEAADRARTDGRLLRHSWERGGPVDARLAEELFKDDKVWEQAPLIDLADRLLAPLDPERHGVAAAALLNTRLRRLRPRVYLRHPETVVVDRLAGGTALEDLRQGIALTVADQTLDVHTALVEETKRGGIRKSVLREACESLVDALQRLGYVPLHQVGDEVKYDPLLHVSADQVAYQSVVLVLRPGLTRSGAVAPQVKAIVAALTNREGE